MRNLPDRSRVTETAPVPPGPELPTPERNQPEDETVNGSRSLLFQFLGGPDMNRLHEGSLFIYPCEVYGIASLNGRKPKEGEAAMS